MRKSENIWTRLCLAVAAMLALSLAAFAAAGPALAAAPGPAVLRVQAQDGTCIAVAAPEGTFAEGMALSADAAGSQSVAGALDAAGVVRDGAAAYELALKNASGAAVDAPDAGYRVTIELGVDALPAGADTSTAAVRLVVDGKCSGAHALSAGAASFETAQLGTLAVTYTNMGEEAPAEPEAPAAGDEVPCARERPAAAGEPASEEPAEKAAAEPAEASGKTDANGAASETKTAQDETAPAATRADAEAVPAAGTAADAAGTADDPGGSSAACAEEAPAAGALGSAAADDEAAASGNDGSSAESGDASGTGMAGAGAAAVLAADPVPAESGEASAAAKSTSAAEEAADGEDGKSTDAADPGASAADYAAAIPSVAAAPAAGTARVYLYVFLDSLPADVRNHLSSHSVYNGTMWVTVGYIDVPTSVLPAAQQGNVRRGYIFKDTYEPKIAAGNSVRYTIHYYTPDYGKGSGTRVDQNPYYQQIEAYVNWNQLGLCVADGADGYFGEAGYRPAWHLDGYYSYSEKTLNVKKAVTGNFGDKEREYGFTASYAKPDGAEETISFTLSDGESRLITVPTSTSITVTENSYSGDGYTTTVTHGDTTANGRTWSTDSLEENTTITFTNHRTIAPDVGTDLASAPYLAVLAGASVFGALFFSRCCRTQG